MHPFSAMRVIACVLPIVTSRLSVGTSQPWQLEERDCGRSRDSRAQHTAAARRLVHTTCLVLYRSQSQTKSGDPRLVHSLSDRGKIASDTD
jgi:hypothetical protein